MGELADEAADEEAERALYDAFHEAQHDPPSLGRLLARAALGALREVLQGAVRRIDRRRWP